MWRGVLVFALLCVSCSRGPVDDVADASPVPPSSSSNPPSTSTSTTTTTEPVEEDPTDVDEAAGQAAAPSFSSSARPVTVDELGGSWRPDCPVGVEALRRVEVSHWNDTGTVVTGVLVMHADHVDAITSVFARLFEAGFPVHSMRPITEFGADDDASMAANNTSMFNCRNIAGSPGVWSQHAYGGAIDINPLVNPWVRGATVDPPAGASYVDRDQDATGMIVAGDVVTQAFADIGWGWGGDWSTTKDYQHFSHNGR